MISKNVARDDGAASRASWLALELCQATKLGHSTEFQLVNPVFTLGRLPAFQDNIARVRLNWLKKVPKTP